MSARAIEKIAGYKGKEKNRTVNDLLVEKLIVPFSEASVLDLLDYLIEGKKKEALKIFLHLLSKKDTANFQIYFLGILRGSIEDLFIVKGLHEKNMVPQEIAEKMKAAGKHYTDLRTIKALVNLSLRFSEGQLKKIYRQLWKIDQRIKTGQATATESVAALILSFPF